MSKHKLSCGGKCGHSKSEHRAFDRGHYAALTPQRALSIRQPWAWLIVNGFKDVENREWKTKYRGRFWVHASGTMTRDDYISCAVFLAGFAGRLRMPAYDVLRKECGGIVGSAELIDCVEHSESPWFTGAYGFSLDFARTCLFTPCKGALNFFVPKYNQ